VREQYSEPPLDQASDQAAHSVADDGLEPAGEQLDEAAQTTASGAEDAPVFLGEQPAEATVDQTSSQPLEPLPQPEKQPFYRSKIYTETVGLLKLMAEVVILFLIFSTLMGGFQIEQHSMDPTFRSGQRVVVSKLSGLLPDWLVGTAQASDGSQSSGMFALKRNEFVVFHSLTNPEEALIKRLVGLPGDTIELRDGAVFINGEQLDEPYINGQRTECHQFCGTIVLGSNQYFMMGDNRLVSLDSRSFGPIPGDKIVGRVILRYWPFDQISFYF
jgi:signal peptidase I